MCELSCARECTTYPPAHKCPSPASSRTLGPVTQPAWPSDPNALPDPLAVPIIARPFDLAIRPPGSKSITNRAILLAALAQGQSTLRGALTDADDAQVMLAAVRRLGAVVEQSGHDLAITGVAGRWRVAPGEKVRIDLHNAGTATRFLAAAALLAPSGTSITIDGDARMRQRPIRELVDAMHAIDAQANYTAQPGFPPVEVPGGTLDRAGAAQVQFGVTSSSQFISALLLIAPFLTHGLSIRLPIAPTSAPYIDMTLRVMRHTGCTAIEDRTEPGGHRTLRIAPAPLSGFAMTIEPDASGATYFQAAAALVPGARITIPGLDLHPSTPPMQGDTRFVGVLSAAGAGVQRLNNALCITGRDHVLPFDVDLADMPDTAMTAAVLACFAHPTPANPHARSILHGLRTLRVKETDRLVALQTELSRIGARVEIIAESWRSQPDEALVIHAPPAASLARPDAPPVFFDTYHDHRMAMSLALVGLRRPNVLIRDPKCVAKTYPTFWEDLSKLYMR